jgi:hypothetical protein
MQAAFRIAVIALGITIVGLQLHHEEECARRHRSHMGELLVMQLDQEAQRKDRQEDRKIDDLKQQMDASLVKIESGLAHTKTSVQLKKLQDDMDIVRKAIAPKKD